MNETIELVFSGSTIKAEIELPGSKSLSNRILMLEYFSGGLVKGNGHSSANDTIKLNSILKELPKHADAGDGGTTSRFALAALASTPGYIGILAGSQRLSLRPITDLVDSLKQIGADLTFIEMQNQLPIRIIGKQLISKQITINGNVSSQFLTAILLLGTSLPEGIEVEIKDELVSRPYLDMTLKLLRKLDFNITEKQRVFKLFPKTWKEVEIDVEKDWSSASYWYSLVAMAPKASILLLGLKIESMQGDSLISSIFRILGVTSHEQKDGVLIEKSNQYIGFFRFDCIDQPDIAQTLAVTITGLQIQGHLTGLKTLRGKETDRIEALKVELQKLNVKVTEPNDGELLIDARFADFSRTVIIDTYNDHRMALAFAPLVVKVYKLAIRNPNVVEKSYPNFWKELRKTSVGLIEWDF
jgi:3-phosphoshikimate 1-carboxyvinyltransferase